MGSISLLYSQFSFSCFPGSFSETGSDSAGSADADSAGSAAETASGSADFCWTHQSPPKNSMSYFKFYITIIITLFPLFSAHKISPCIFFGHLGLCLSSVH